MPHINVEESVYILLGLYNMFLQLMVQIAESWVDGLGQGFRERQVLLPEYFRSIYLVKIQIPSNRDPSMLSIADFIWIKILRLVLLKIWKLNYWKRFKSGKNAGERIILCADINEPISRSSFVQDLEHIGLVSSMRKHDHTTPPTHNRGTDTIDCIYLSPEIRVTAAGFSDFGDGPGDHRTVFIDVPRIDIEGAVLSSIQRLPRRRLISTNATVSNTFNILFQKQNLNFRKHLLNFTSNYPEDLPQPSPTFPPKPLGYFFVRTVS